MKQSRRLFLQKSLVYGAGVAALVNSSLYASQVLADWPSQAYDMKEVDDVLHNLYGNNKLIETTKIHIKAPEIAENGAVVPVSVKANMENIESISILVEKNPNPLVAKFGMKKNQKGHISTRIKMSKSSNVIAVIKADGKLYSARQKVKVTIGGCGG
jgi:sulfur-oxidizing protein SoxY